MIIQKLGGTIVVKSQPGQGTTRVIQLPLRDSPMAVHDPGTD